MKIMNLDATNSEVSARADTSTLEELKTGAARRPLRVGVICSAGGSAFLEVATACPHVEFLVVTDRPCGVEEACRTRGIAQVRVEDKSNALFSEKAAVVLREWGQCDFVIMFFARLVTEPLLSDFKLLNIHPALLPAFKGIGAVRLAREFGVRYFGATLHVANADMDAGPIIAQACQAIRPTDALPYLEKLSFIHKVCLFLLAVDLLETGNLSLENGRPVLNPALPASDRMNPALHNPAYLDYVDKLQQREGVCFL
jgi:phosphoribosylglycinamide formyltransferase-1